LRVISQHRSCRPNHVLYGLRVGSLSKALTKGGSLGTTPRRYYPPVSGQRLNHFQMPWRESYKISSEILPRSIYKWPPLECWSLYIKGSISQKSMYCTLVETKSVLSIAPHMPPQRVAGCNKFPFGAVTVTTIVWPVVGSLNRWSRNCMALAD